MICRSPIATYNITGIADGIASIGEKRLGQPNTTLVFLNDMNGIVYLKEAFLKVRYEYQEEVEVAKPKNVLKSSDQGDEGKKEVAEEDAVAKQAEEDAATKQAEEDAAAKQSEEDAAAKQSEEDAAAKQSEEDAAAKQTETEKEKEKETQSPTEGDSDSDADAETEPEKTSLDEPLAKEGANESSGEKEPKKDIVVVTKRKIRKIPLRVTSLLDRLVILPMTDAERQRSKDL